MPLHDNIRVADAIKNNDVTTIFMIYLEFIHGKENVFQLWLGP